MASIFNPYDEPGDPHDLNKHGVEWLAFAMCAIPFIGIGPSLACIIQSAFDDNQFNLSNTFHNTGVLGLIVQTAYIVAALVMYL